jgi:hypothetical protein
MKLTFTLELDPSEVSTALVQAGVQLASVGQQFLASHPDLKALLEQVRPDGPKGPDGAPATAAGANGPSGPWMPGPV